MSKVFIGVAWPYANGAIHLGHVAGCYLPPDIFARYHRMKGNEVLMVSGSDQHGTPITVTAEREGVSPQEIAERYHRINTEALEKLGISFDLFFKTSHQHHKEVVQDIFLKLLENGHIYRKEMIALYCPVCSRFLPDRYVEGTCPHCGDGNARGDQCDECGKTLDPEELIDPRCKLCSSVPVRRGTEHFFFALSNFEEDLKEYISDKQHWRSNTQNFTRNWLEAGLKDRAITRDLTWGVGIPVEGFGNKRVYVWFEAVIGYLSASKEWARLSGDEELWRAFWQDRTVKHYYFLGKDNIPFHTIIWPAILMGHGGLNLPYDVPANEYLRFKGEQFSKSRGISIEIPNFLERFETDALRYYLSVNMPENRDADFTWDDFIQKNNTELLATFGNFVHRVLSFTYKHFGTVPEQGELEDLHNEALESISKSVEETGAHIEKCEFKKGVKSFIELAQYGNRYLVVAEPWKTIKTERERCATSLHVALRIVKALATMGYPFIPFAAQRLWKMLGYGGDLSAESWDSAVDDIPAGQKLAEPVPLFKKLEMPEEEGSAMDKLDLRIGEVTSVEPHPDADKLYIMKVNLGTEERQLVAGLRPYYAHDEIKGMKIVVVANLAPAKLRGEISQGMLLAAEDEKGTVSLLTPVDEVQPGARVSTMKGMKATGFSELAFEEFKKYDLRVGEVFGVKESEGTLTAEVDVGHTISSEIPSKSEKLIEKKLVFLVGERSPLVAEGDVLITVHRNVENGAKVL